MQTVEKQIEKAQQEQASDKPLYVTLKDYVRSRVETGEWAVGHRVPSENELVELLGVSRMTANRALRELADEGFVVRVQGKGSFVASKKRRRSFRAFPILPTKSPAMAVSIQPMSSYCGWKAAMPNWQRHCRSRSAARCRIRSWFHAEDSVPMQIEDRFRQPRHRSALYRSGFRQGNAERLSHRHRADREAEQHIEAVTAQPWECKLLAISKTEPCLLVRRRTWSDAGVISSVRLLYPGSRYRLYST